MMATKFVRFLLPEALPLCSIRGKNIQTAKSAQERAARVRVGNSNRSP